MLETFSVPPTHGVRLAFLEGRQDIAMWYNVPMLVGHRIPMLIVYLTQYTLIGNYVNLNKDYTLHKSCLCICKYRYICLFFKNGVMFIDII